MSAYVDFFIRNKDDFIPIADYSRNSMIYSIVNNDVPYEKIRAITTQDINKFINVASEKIRECEQGIRKEKERIKLVATFDNSIEEKLEVIAQYEEGIEEYTQSIEECTYAKNFFSFLTELINVRRWEENSSVNINEYIYAGIEIGRPTVEDIV